MRLKIRTMLAIGCVGLLAMNIPAFSIPAPHGLERQPGVAKKKPAQANPASHGKSQAARDNRVRLVSMPLIKSPKRPVFGWPVLVREARKYMGTNPTARTRLWCATFMNMVLAKAGYAGTNSDAAKSFAYYGHRISEPQVGAIAVLTRGKKGGHVGVVSGVDARGNPIIISGNHGHKVGEAVYPRSRVIAYVMPTDRRPVGEAQVASSTALSARSASGRPSSAPVIDSPITELLAAIEAERNRLESKPRPVPSSEPLARPAEPPVPRRVAQQTPHLTVQQMPEPLPPPPRVSPQRPQPAPQRVGRVARADTVLPGSSVQR